MEKVATGVGRYTEFREDCEVDLAVIEIPDLFDYRICVGCRVGDGNRRDGGCYAEKVRFHNNKRLIKAMKGSGRP